MGTVSHVSDSELALIANWNRFAPKIDEAEALHLLHEDLTSIELGLSGLRPEAQLEQHQFDAPASSPTP